MQQKEHKAGVDGAELDVWVVGEGAPILFIHGVMFRDAFAPLVRLLAEEGGFQLITYGRRGYGGQTTGPIDIPGQTRDAAAVLDALGVKKAHWVGHSYGAAIALQAGAQCPDRVLSLGLFEHPLLPHTPSGPAMGEGMAPVVEQYMSGDKEGALKNFNEANGGSKELVDKVLPPGSYAQALGDVDTLFQIELPALGEWVISPEEMKAIKAPTLWMSGADSLPPFREAGQVTREWMPQTQCVDVEGASHFFPLQRPEVVAKELSRFVRSLS